MIGAAAVHRQRRVRGVNSRVHSERMTDGVSVAQWSVGLGRHQGGGAQCVSLASERSGLERLNGVGER